VYNLCQSEQFGTEHQVSPLHRIGIDEETQSVIFLVELDAASFLGKARALANHERAGSF
jgi:hypothetical protein